MYYVIPLKTYDKDLARVAQAYADKCTWGHNGQRTAQVKGKYTYVGENVYATTKSRDVFDVVQAVQSWYSEVNDYNFERNSCTAGKICGHYTQVSEHYCNGDTVVNIDSDKTIIGQPLRARRVLSRKSILGEKSGV